LWIARDADGRGVKDGDAIRIYNQRGEMQAAFVTGDHRLP
jgi:anaerobic selenocysteine-containing dehydrogenase